MSWGIEIVAGEFAEEMKQYGLKLDVRQGILVTSEKAIKLRLGERSDKYRKILRDAINYEKAKKKAKQQAKQTSLLDQLNGGVTHEHNSNGH